MLRLFIEKFIEEPHHIEIQLLADGEGKVVCFPERECSVQRRNQKVLEESPSALLTPEVRAEMCRQAAMLAKAVNYRYGVEWRVCICVRAYLCACLLWGVEGVAGESGLKNEKNLNPSHGHQYLNHIS